MKKRNLKTLKLNKNSISNFNNLIGGLPPQTFNQRYCPKPDKPKPSRFINSDCIGCSITTVSG